jgi:type IV fimbrial biogenesis protein FimT
MRTGAFSTGVTLLELMIALSIVAILGTLAVPSFSGLLHDSERTTAVNSFVHSLYLARSEAIKRGEVVSLCKSANGENCSNTAPDWNGGWMVFINEDRDEPPVRDANEPVIAVYEGWPTGHITSNRSAYSFRAYTQAVVNGTIVFCDSRGSAHARAVIISHTGRPRVTQRDASNKPLKCG